MSNETKWNLKQAELNARKAQQQLPPAEAHQLQAAIEIIKSVAHKVEGK